VFEKILEAVDGGRSAEVITVANQLLDAGNSPAQLARQFVRYLRNCVIAKIAGIGVDGAGADGVAGELLQISADEQRRAGRSAALFSEEELTRFLQVMLRTFDELGYRQEQRFHFELGLLKLVHLRRLLPIEEVLSQFPVGGGSGQVRTAGATTKSSSPSATAAGTTAKAVEASSRPAFSPFEQDKNRRRFEERGPVESPVVRTQPVAAPMPVPSPVKVPEPVNVPAEMVLTEGDELGATLERVGDAAEASMVATPAIDLLSSLSAASLQKASVAALISAKSQETAADAMADAEWLVADGEVRVQTELSKTMLSMVINPDAEKLMKAALREAGAGALKLILLPGVKTAAAAKKPKAVKTGSVQARALEHPIVQRAQTLFNAEIQSVIDLRDNE
jgi:DNA polymerase-3 subunit gamma/tau